MATETELERMVVRLTGDVTHYVKALKDAENRTKDAAGQIEDSTKRMEKGFKDMALGVAGVLAGLKFGEFLKGSFQEFSTAESIGIKLTSTLKANGRAVEETRADYEEFAASMQKMTTAEDDAVLAMLESAETFQLTGSAAKKAVADALALAKGNEELAQSYLRVTTAVADGNMERAMMFARSIPQLRGIRNEAEFLDKYQKSVVSGMEASAGIAKTAAGGIQQLENDYGNLKETVGGFVAEAVIPVTTWMKELTAWFQRQSPEVQKLVTYTALAVAVFSSMALAGESVADTLKNVVKELKEFGKGITVGVNAPLALAVVAVAAFVAILRESGKEMRDAADEAENLNDKLAGLTTKEGKRAMDRVREAAPSEQGRVLEEELTAAKKKVEEYAKSVKSAQAEITALGGDPLSIREILGTAGGDRGEGRKFLSRIGRQVSEDADINQARDRLAGLQKNLNAARAARDMLLEEKQRPGKAAGGWLVPMITAAQMLAKELKNVRDQARESHMDKLVSDAEALIDRLKTPLEKIEDQRFRLDEMLMNKVLPQEFYERGLKDLEEQLLGTAEAQRTLNQEVERSATGFGSAEALARIGAFGGGTAGFGGSEPETGFGEGVGFVGPDVVPLLRAQLAALMQIAEHPSVQLTPAGGE